MPLTLVLDGNQQIIEASMDAFAKQHGWHADSELTQAEHSANVIKAFLRESIKTYNCNKAAEQARVAAAAATEAAADAMTITLVQD